MGVAADVVTKWSTASKAGPKGEDMIVAVSRRWPLASVGALNLEHGAASACLPSQPPSYQLFAAFDGHNGAKAARCAAASVVPVLEEQMANLLAEANARDVAEGLQEALVLTCLEAQRRVALTGTSGGCTATLVLQVGRLVTVASLGSSSCVLDTGAPGPWVQLSKDHVLGTNRDERQRLAAAGCHVAPALSRGGGPAPSASAGDGVLRLWPGGLTLSRAVGDFNLRVGEAALLPLPHIKQVLVPPSGGRLVIATDGVWSRAGEGLQRVVRAAPLSTAADDVLATLSPSRRGTQPDSSVIVVDVLPPRTTFQGVCSQKQRQGSGIMPPQLQRAFSLLSRGRRSSSSGSSSSSSSSGSLQAAAQQQEQCSLLPELVADYDAAALVGLAAESPSGSSSPVTPAFGKPMSRNNSHEWSAGPTAAAVAAAAAQRMLGQAPLQLPGWCDSLKAARMLRLMADAHHTWRQARHMHTAAQTAVAALPAAAAAVDVSLQALRAAKAAAAATVQKEPSLAPMSPRPLLRVNAMSRGVSFQLSE